jgi:proline iminopeptidase
MLRQKELSWFYQEGTSYIFPDAWDEYLKPIPIGEEGDMITAYYKRLTNPDLQI